MIAGEMAKKGCKRRSRRLLGVDEYVDERCCAGERKIYDGRKVEALYNVERIQTTLVRSESEKLKMRPVQGVGN